MSSAVSRLTDAVAAVAPIDGVAILEAGTPLEIGWHVVSNASTTPPTFIRIDYQETATIAEIAAGDEVAVNFDLQSGERRPRVLYDIYVEVGALTGQQKLLIGNDLFSGSPPKVSQDVGVNAPDLLTLWILQQSGTLSTADKNLLKQAAISVFTLDNPTYLVHPSFDPSILIYGDEPVTE